MYKQRVHGADADKLMSLNALAGVQDKHNEALAFRVEIGMRRDVQPPIGGGLLRGVAQLQAFRRGTFPQRLDFIFVWLRRKFEWRDELVKSGEGGLVAAF